jgi:hypothetical protein
MKPAPLNENPFTLLVEAVAGFRPESLILYAIIYFMYTIGYRKVKSGVVNEQ